MTSYKLWENRIPFYNESFGQPEPMIHFYPAESDNTRGCVIVCPGGGYEMRAYHEGEPVAQMFNKAGIHAFVLDYRFEPYDRHAVCSDVTRAVRFAKYNAEKLGYDKNHIGILGFSAGGHAALCAIEHFDNGIETGDEIDQLSSRPDAGILCYPVVTLGEYTHEATRRHFLGHGINDANLRKKFSGECSVREDMPPVFIWHNADDNGVSVMNSINLSIALTEKKIPYEMHIFPFGGHGEGLSENNPISKQWPELSVNWLKNLGF